MTTVALTEQQATAIAHLAALFGPGEVQAHEEPLLRWVWYRTVRQHWCIDEKGDLRGWNDAENAA